MTLRELASILVALLGYGCRLVLYTAGIMYLILLFAVSPSISGTADPTVVALQHALFGKTTLLLMVFIGMIVAAFTIINRVAIPQRKAIHAPTCHDAHQAD